MPYTVQKLGTYVLPNCNATSDDLDRTTGADLLEMDDRQRKAERYALQAAWAWGVLHCTRAFVVVVTGPPVHALTWIEDRIRRIDAMLKQGRVVA